MSNDNYIDDMQDRGTRMMRSHYDKLNINGQMQKQVNVSNGKLKVFGYEFDVGPQAAGMLGPLISQGLSNIGRSLSGPVTKMGTNLASLLLPASQAHNALKIGKALGALSMIGVPFMDVGLSVKKTIVTGFSKMRDLRDQAQPLLAANGVGGIYNVHSCNFGAYRDARVRIYEESKRNVLSNAIDFIRVAPTAFMMRYESKLNDIRNPELLKGQLNANMPAAEQQKLKAYIDKLEQMKTPVVPATPTGDNHHQNSNMFTAFFQMLGDRNRMNSLLHPKTEADYHQALHDLNLTPAFTALIAEMFSHKMNKKPVREIAWDKIMVLQEYMERHRDKADRGRVTVFVKDVLQQRAKDLSLRGEIEGQDFNETAAAIADTIVSGLHPQAIAEIMDNRQIVAFGPRDVDFGDSVDVKDELEKIKEKYSHKVSEKELKMHADFSMESLPQIWKSMPEDEKPFLAQLFPAGFLEKAGVSKDEVKKARETGKDDFEAMYKDSMKMLLETSPEALKQDGVKEKLIRKITDFRQAYEQAQERGNEDGFLDNNTRATDLLRNTLVTAPKFWQERMKARGVEAAERLHDDDNEERPHHEHAKRKHGRHESEESSRYDR